jgi:hypothetical protein
MSMSIKKRLALGAGALATVGAVGTLMAGVTFGLFTSSAGTQSNTFKSGTVTLTQNVSSAPCAVTLAVPGDHGSCTLVVNYSGNVPAYIGLDVSASGALLSASNNDTNGLHYTVTEGATDYTAGGSNLLVSTTADTNGSSHTFTVSWDIPSGTDNSFQSASATIDLTAHAVQSANQGNVSGCTAGSTCSGITWG